MSSLLEQASLVVTPNGTKASKLYSVKPTDGSGDMTVVRSTTATRVNSSGLIESSAINVPRLDYTGSTCPSILVEPQRTNIALWSDMFENSTWSKASGVIVTANVEISPDGTLTADYIQFGASNSFVNQTTTLNIGVVATGSFYIKGTNGETIQMSVGGVDVLFTLNGNWQRIEATRTSISNNFNINTFGSSTARNIYLWGAQLEVGANATSYIPTVASAVTRNADVFNAVLPNNGMTFTAYLELKEPIDASFSGDWLQIYSDVFILGRAFGYANRMGFANDYDLGTDISTAKKLLWKQESGTTAKIFVDGVLIATSTSGTYSNPFNRLSIYGNFFNKPAKINKFILFDENLTDQQCIDLTTI